MQEGNEQCLPDDPIGQNVSTVNKPLLLSLKNAIFFKRGGYKKVSFRA